MNHPGRADRAVEFIDSQSALANAIDKEYWVKKEVERKKFRSKNAVAEIQKAGFPSFRMLPHHVDMWKADDAKNPGNGFGPSVQGTWS